MELQVLETEGAFSLTFDGKSFDVFKNEQLERSFDKLEDAQDALWLTSVDVPDFDW